MKNLEESYNILHNFKKFKLNTNLHIFEIFISFVKVKNSKLKRLYKKIDVSNSL